MPQNKPSKRQNGFGRRSLYPKAQPSFAGLRYLKQKSSFWIAALSLIAFFSGNIIGQHGFYAFLKAALGAGDDSMIVYNGVMAPVTKVPNWSKLTGVPQDYTYRLVPQDSLMDLPPYSALQDEHSPFHDAAELTYSVAHAGDYKTGALHAGAHDGVDIRMPVGTPLLAMGNGRVIKVNDDPAGLGLYVTIKLPNVPNPNDPKKTTNLYCTIGHMSAQTVVVDQIVKKGDPIGFSGKTGFATGAHAHVQCDDESAPYIPYSPFTGAELREAGISFTQAINTGFHQERIFAYSVDPLAYVEAKYPGVKGATIAGKPSGTDVASADTALTDQPSIKPIKRAQALREERLSRRVSQRRAVLGEAITVRPGPSVVSTLVPVSIPAPQAASSAASVASAAASSAPAVTAVGTDVARIEFSVPDSFRGRSWETVRLTLLDADGHKVTQPKLANDITVRPAYGTAEIRPQVLSALDFKDGVAEIKVLPRGTRTVVLEVPAPWNVLSNAIRYEQ